MTNIRIIIDTAYFLLHVLGALSEIASESLRNVGVLQVFIGEELMLEPHIGMLHVYMFYRIIITG